MVVSARRGNGGGSSYGRLTTCLQLTSLVVCQSSRVKCTRTAFSKCAQAPSRAVSLGASVGAAERYRLEVNVRVWVRHQIRNCGHHIRAGVKLMDQLAG